MIRNRDSLGGTDARELALACVDAAVRAARPGRAVERAVSVDGDALRVDGATYDLGAFDDVVIVGGGKAAAGLTRALVDALDGRVADGVVVVPADEAGRAGPVELAPGGHPTPTAAGVGATERALDVLRAADDRTLVLAPITGGGSALLEAPAAGLGLDAVTDVTRALLDAGAPIGDVNAVRRHLSAVKGGRAAAAAAPAAVVGLLVSDVVGDDPAVVASGPTVPDGSAPADAVDALDRHGVDAPAVRRHLRDAQPPPSADGSAFDRVRNVVVADAGTALAAAAETARSRGADARIVSERVVGEASRRGREGAALARSVAACGDAADGGATVLLTGGETTVTVTGDGRGGPNTEYALAAARDLAGADPDRDGDVGARIAVAAVDTDGRDGSTDAAGAVVDGDTLSGVGAAAADAALADSDSLSLLESVGGAVVRTGATGTNVNDLRVHVVAPP